MAKTITSANSSFILAIPNLFAATEIQGYAADDMFSVAPVKSVETVMGADGKLSFGYTPVVTVMTIMLMPDSDSGEIFDEWGAAQDAVRETYPATAVITLSGTGDKYTLTRGALTSWVKMPSAKKVLQARPFEITWQQVLRMPA